MTVANLPIASTRMGTSQRSYFAEDGNSLFVEVEVENTLNLTERDTSVVAERLSEEQERVQWGNFIFFYSGVELELLPNNYIRLIIEYSPARNYGPITLQQHRNNERSREICLDDFSFPFEW